MPPSERSLYQLPTSHDCEKTRWNLDAKGLSYDIENLVPGPHLMVMRRLTKGGRGTVPALVDRGTVVTDSTGIALHLERAYPSAPALVPASGPERERVLELESFFDELGTHVRRWAHANRFAGGADHDPLMSNALAAPLRLTGGAMLPLIKRFIPAQNQPAPEKVEVSRVKLFEGLDRLEREIQGDPSRYLVGSSLSIADISAASLYGSLIAAPGSPYKSRPGEIAPPVIAELCAAVLARPAGQWVLRRYQEDRQRPARGFAATAEAVSG